MKDLIRKIIKEETTKYSSPEEIIAATIASEAAGEGELGMRAVAHVIKNRATEKYNASDPKSMKKVVLKPYQFSGWNDVNKESIMDITKKVDFFKKKYKSVWDKALEIAKNPGQNPIGSRNHYYNPKKASPSWGSNESFLKTKKQIGNHLFGKI